MDSNLKYLGMAGLKPAVSLSDSLKPSGLMLTPNISTPINTGGNWWDRNGNIVTGVTNSLSSLALTTAHVVNILRSDEPLIIKQPGQPPKDYTTEMKKVYKEKGDDGINQALMLLMAQNQNRPQQPKEDKTMLYVGLGVGAVVLLGGMMYMMKK